ncbi:MAG: ribonuclease HII [Myxococcaceae bacterium]|nr:ribonuclease HII [Myxococcaceae bacterium]MCI0671097.1 ribonuclease HII [Myxococcaceae bacterium]
MAPRASASSLKLSELRARYVENGEPVSSAVLRALARDERKGAQTLLRVLRARVDHERAEAARCEALLRFERELWAQGVVHIAGVDEAGMAPLAGPVVAAAVILPRDYKLAGLDDSKKVLDPARREVLAAQVKADAVAWAVGVAEVEEIDRLNIYHAGLLAMRRAVLGLAVMPQHVLVDARTIPDCPAPQRGIIRGDAQSASIAAASMVAKTTRDARMAELDARFPGWGLAGHKGYPTPEHLRALKERGVSPIHRRTFAPVREALSPLPLGEGQGEGKRPLTEPSRQSDLFLRVDEPR